MPAISVIVPTYERPERLARCLAALAGLDYPRDRFEVLVVDDGGRRPIGRDLVGTTAIDVRFLRHDHAGPAAARNHGAGEARYGVLAFIDDDCLPRRDWLRAIGRRHGLAPESAISGRTINAVDGNRYSIASQALIDYLQDYYLHPKAGARFATSSNLAFPAHTFRAMRGFDTNFARAGGEDRELCDRWIAEGRDIQYAEDAIVDHHHAMSLASFWCQHVNYGRGAYEFRRARRRRLAAPVPVEPLSFYVGLVRRPAHECPGWPSLTLLALLSQVANAAGFMVEALKVR